MFISSFSLTPVFLEILDNSFMTSSGLIFFVSGFSSTLIILGFAISLAAWSTNDGSINKKLFASCTFSFISSKLGSSCSFSTCLSNSSISYDSVSSQLSSIGSNCSWDFFDSGSLSFVKSSVSNSCNFFWSFSLCSFNFFFSSLIAEKKSFNSAALTVTDTLSLLNNDSLSFVP